MTIRASNPSAPRAPLSRIAMLQQLDTLRQLPATELKILADFAVLRAFEPRMRISSEQTVARTLFVVLTGNVEQAMHDADEAEVTLAMLGRGDVFGEGGLFGLRYRRTTVRATTRATVLQFRNADVQAASQRLPEFFSILRQQFRERLLQTTLARVPLLASLNPLERLSISQQLDDRRVERGEVILEAGGTSEGLFVVAEGQAVVKRDDRPLAVIEPGDIFGEMSLIDNIPHEATITALTPVHLLLVPRATYDYLIHNRDDIAADIRELASARRKQDRTPEHIATTRKLIETGIIRGDKALVRRQELCLPNCHRCVDACGDRFGLPRLAFDGTMFDGLEAAATCRHCRWGAECVEACPEDAFRLDPEGHLVVTDRCTGCGACVTACPYDAINQIPIYPVANNPLIWLMQQVRRPAPAMLRANKCDGCSGYDDQACVSACPTGALQWVSVESLYAAG